MRWPPKSACPLPGAAPGPVGPRNLTVPLSPRREPASRQVPTLLPPDGRTSRPPRPPQSRASIAGSLAFFPRSAPWANCSGYDARSCASGPPQIAHRAPRPRCLLPVQPSWLVSRDPVGLCRSSYDPPSSGSGPPLRRPPDPVSLAITAGRANPAPPRPDGGRQTTPPFSLRLRFSCVRGWASI